MNSKINLTKIIHEEYNRAILLREQSKEFERVVNNLPGVQKRKVTDGMQYFVPLQAKSKRSVGATPDTLVLNPDGTAQKKIQGTKYTYKFIPNNIVIFQTGTRIGTLKVINNEVVLNIEEVTNDSNWIDTLQTVLDWAGLVPVYGDAIDIVNGIIYAAREKYFDAALSLIAVIPVVGSVAKLGIKNIGKPVAKVARGVFIGSKASRYRATEKFWDVINKSGVIDQKVLRGLSNGLDEMGSYIRQTKSYSKKFGIDSPQFSKALDEISDFFKNSETILSKSVSRSTKASKFAEKQLIDLARKVPVFNTVAKDLVKHPGWFRRTFRAFSLNPLKMRRLRILFDINPNKLNDISKYLRKSFDDKLINPQNAGDLLLIAKSIPFNKMKDIKFPFDTGAFRVKNYKLNFGDLINNLKSPDEFKIFGEELAKLDSKTYEQFAKNIIEVAKEENTLLYFTRLGNQSLNMKAILDPKQYMEALFKDKRVGSTLLSMANDYYRNIRFLGKKQLDIISNEVEEIMDEMGISASSGPFKTDSVDNMDSVFMAVPIESIKEAVGEEQYQSAKKITINNVLKPLSQLLTMWKIVDIQFRPEIEETIMKYEDQIPKVIEQRKLEVDERKLLQQIYDKNQKERFSKSSKKQ